MWKSTPERCGKQVENFCYMALWGVTRIHGCFQITSAPWLHKACTVNRSRKPFLSLSNYFLRRRRRSRHNVVDPDQPDLPAVDSSPTRFASLSYSSFSRHSSKVGAVCVEAPVRIWCSKASCYSSG
jgi:hypothetical protein